MTATGLDDNVYRMPSLGADMTEGRIIEWLAEPGARLERGDLVAVVETDKSDIEVEVFHPCVIEEYLVDLGEVVRVGEPVARLATTGGPPPSEHRVEREQPVAEQPVERERPLEQPAVARPLAPTTRTPAAPAASGMRARVTPRARRLARDQGITLDQFAPERTVTGDDVLRLADRAAQVAPDHARAPTPPSTQAPAAPESAAPESDQVAADRAVAMRRAIARRMEKSWTEIPHYHVTDTIDVTDVIQRIRLHNTDLGPSDRLLLPAVLNVALAGAASEVGSLNGWWRDDRFVPASGVDLGVVLSLRGGGIVVPTIGGAEHLGCAQMMQAMRELVERARRGRLRAADAADASITVSNLGEAGAASVLGVIHPPQVALIGLGGVRDEPRVVGERVESRRVVHLSVAGDHRAHDGATASQFIHHLTRLLEHLP